MKVERYMVEGRQGRVVGERPAGSEACPRDMIAQILSMTVTSRPASVLSQTDVGGGLRSGDNENSVVSGV